MYKQLFIPVFFAACIVLMTQPVAAGISSDTDDNRKIDIFDYNTLLTHFGRTGANGKSDGDLDRDFDVDIFDYNQIISDFGMTTLTVHELLPDGGRVDWSPATGTITFDRRGDDGYYDIYTITADLANEQCLTCDNPLFSWHVGNPAWDPTGQFILFQGQTKAQTVYAPLSEPGKGVNHDLYIMQADGSAITQLTNLSARTFYGVLHPQFSHDGTQVTWAQLQTATTWSIQVADITYQGSQPVLSNIRSFQPGENPRFYETSGFSADDAHIIFSGTPDPDQTSWGADIYMLNIATGELTNLTNTNTIWEEHAHLSPDGSQILYMSGEGTPAFQYELWLMDADGTNKEQLTRFHTAGYPEYDPDVAGPADNAWGPSGHDILFYRIADSAESAGSIYLLTFTP